MYYTVASFYGREEFGAWLTLRGLVDVGIEVGTHRGAFARQILDTWPGKLICVDPWTIPPGYEYQATLLEEAGATREDDYQAAQELLSGYTTGDNFRCHFWRLTSAQAADRTIRQLDFVYLDGDHESPGFAQDLNRWWDKIKSGGVLAGHDIVCPGERCGGWGGKFIQPAVELFAKIHAVPIHLIVERHSLPWSFYLEKP